MSLATEGKGEKFSLKMESSFASVKLESSLSKIDNKIERILTEIQKKKESQKIPFDETSYTSQYINEIFQKIDRKLDTIIKQLPTEKSKPIFTELLDTTDESSTDCELLEYKPFHAKGMSYTGTKKEVKKVTPLKPKRKSKYTYESK